MKRLARWRSVAGVVFALCFVLFVQAVPAHAAPAWKDAVAEIEATRDQAVADFFELGGVFQEFLGTGPTAEEAFTELAATLAAMGQIGSDAVAEIESIMGDFPGSSEVQQTGSFAIGLIGGAETFSKGFATFRYNEYIDSLPPETPPPSATTTTLPATTTTAAPPATTTTTAPSVTTTTAPSATTTTTSPPATTTTAPTATTTSTPSSPATTTTTTTTLAPSSSGGTVAPPPSGGAEEEGSVPPLDSSVIGDIGGPVRQGSRSDQILDPTFFGETLGSSMSEQRGLTASLTRVLEPLLPTQVADVVVSPLLILELLWRAISSSGRGLVAPISLLVFTVLSLLWDWRRSRRATSAAPA